MKYSCECLCVSSSSSWLLELCTTIIDHNHINMYEFLTIHSWAEAQGSKGLYLYTWTGEHDELRHCHIINRPSLEVFMAQMTLWSQSNFNIIDNRHPAARVITLFQQILPVGYAIHYPNWLPEKHRWTIIKVDLDLKDHFRHSEWNLSSPPPNQLWRSTATNFNALFIRTNYVFQSSITHLMYSILV